MTIIDRLFTPANASPVPLVKSRGGGLNLFGKDSHTPAALQSMGSVGTVFAIVTKTANGVSMVDWSLYKRAVSGRDEDRTEVATHPALSVWERPNPFMSRQQFVETVAQHLDLTGEMWWVVARDPRFNLPIELWPVAPHRMSVVKHPTEFISGYVYTSPDGEKVPLELDQVVFVKSPNPADPYRGLGPVQAILADLDSARFTAQWQRNFFFNSAVPGGIIEVPEHLSDSEFDELRDRWRIQHQGVDNAHRVAILERGSFKPVQNSLKDMQFTELRMMTSEVIREAFGFPKAMLGTTDDVNRANAEASMAIFGQWLLVPRLERFKGALNTGFLALYGKDAQRTYEFDFDNPVPPDHEAERADLTARSQAASVLVTAGFEPSDVLAAVGLPEMRFTPRVSTESPSVE